MGCFADLISGRNRRSAPAVLASLLILAAASRPMRAQASAHYVFVSDQRIVTVELIDQDTVILNYINVSDTIQFIRAPQVVIRDAAGNLYRGHVIENENPEDPSKRYTVGTLVEAKTFQGYTILGNFQFQSPPVQAIFRVGGVILELYGVTPRDFERFAAKIGELDLDWPNAKQAVQAAGFNQGYGQAHHPGEPRFEELEHEIPDLDLLPPTPLSGPAPRLPASESKRPDPVVVQLSMLVTRYGAMQNIEVKQGINKKLDQMAIDTVRNSWKILPAISKGELSDATLTLNVVFAREDSGEH